jgi:hypothetical protein
MSKLICLLFLCFSINQVHADTCYRKYKESNGTTTFSQANCNDGSANNNSSKTSTQQSTNAQKSAAFFGGIGKSLSLNFESIEFRSLFQVFSDAANINISTDDSVAGATSVALNDIPWTEAIYNIISRNKLVVVKVRTGYYVCPASMSDNICEKRAFNKGL